MKCPSLEAPENGHINCLSRESVYNSQCSFTCNQDYSLVGQKLLTCDRHGNWTGEKPTCEGETSKKKKGQNDICVCHFIAWTVSWKGLIIIPIISTASTSATIAIATSVTAGGAATLSGLAIWILKRLRKKATKFELNRSDEHLSLLMCTVICFIKAFIELPSSCSSSVFSYSNSDIEAPLQVYKNSIDSLT